MKRTHYLSLAISALSLLPAVALAQQVNLDYFRTLLIALNALLAFVTPVLFALGILGFLYGVVQYFLSAGDEDKRKSAVEVIKYGLVFLVVMFGIYGIIQILGTVLGVQFGVSAIQRPLLPF